MMQPAVSIGLLPVGGADTAVFAVQSSRDFGFDGAQIAAPQMEGDAA